MFLGLLPPGALEILLFAVLVGVFGFVVWRVRRRARFGASDAASAEPLPDLPTEVRVQAIVRRLFRDAAQSAWVIEGTIGRRKFVFRPTDYTPERYRPLLNQKVDFALFGLATLAPGGIDSIRDQIADIDKVDVNPDTVRLIPVSGFANDYAVIGRVVAAREEILVGEPVVAYRTQVVRQDDLTLVLDLAAESAPGSVSPPFSDGDMVHGSARLFCRLAA